MTKPISKAFAQLLSDACEKQDIKKGDIYLLLSRVGCAVQRSGPYAWLAQTALPRSSKLSAISEVLKIPLLELQAAYEESGGTISFAQEEELWSRSVVIDAEAIEFLRDLVDKLGPLPLYLAEQLLERRAVNNR
jgi:hypothetical protein